MTHREGVIHKWARQKSMMEGSDIYDHPSLQGSRKALQDAYLTKQGSDVAHAKQGFTPSLHQAVDQGDRIAAEVGLPPTDHKMYKDDRSLKKTIKKDQQPPDLYTLKTPEQTA